jgi:hypothetical protein
MSEARALIPIMGTAIGASSNNCKLDGLAFGPPHPKRAGRRLHKENCDALHHPLNIKSFDI